MDRLRRAWLLFELMMNACMALGAALNWSLILLFREVISHVASPWVYQALALASGLALMLAVVGVLFCGWKLVWPRDY